MTRIVVDAALKQRFQNFVRPIELCDEHGRVLARMTPVADDVTCEPLTPDIDEATLRRRAEVGRVRLDAAEVAARMESA